MQDEFSNIQVPRPRSSSLPTGKNEPIFQADLKEKAVPMTPFVNELEPDQLFMFSSTFLPASRYGSMQELRRSSFSGASVLSELWQNERGKSNKKLKKDEDEFTSPRKLRSEKSLESISQDREADFTLIPLKAESTLFLSHEFLPPPPRPCSALGIFYDEEPPRNESHSKFRPEMSRGKSMPSLHLNLDRQTSNSDKSTKSANLITSADKSSTGKLNSNPMHNVQIPGITITEHSPANSVQFFLNQDTCESPRDESPHPPIIYPPCRQLTITRSQTDSNISYFMDLNPEAPGSLHYITKSGQISLLVILKSCHAVTLRECVCSLRVCQGILNNLNMLIALGLLDAQMIGYPNDEETDSTNSQKFQFQCQGNTETCFRHYLSKMNYDLLFN